MTRRQLVVALLATVVASLTVIGAVALVVPRADAGMVSPTLTVTPPSTTPFPPGATTNLVASVVRTGSVTLTWTAAPRGCCVIAAYDITYTQAFNDIVWQTSVAGTATTATISTLSRASEYRFSVSARDDQGRRGGAASVTFVTPATDTGPDTTPPSKPADFAASNVTAASATLSWSPSTDDVGVTGYQVYKFDGLWASTLVATVTGTSYTALLSPGRNLFYIRARDAAGNVSLAAGTISVNGTGTPTTGPTPCRVVYTVQSQWTGGFVAAVTVHNQSSVALNGWTLGFRFTGDQRITSAWGVSVFQNGAVVTADSAAWNGAIPVGGSASFGFQGSWVGGNPAPTAFTLNGGPCTA
ncbi:cellulose binding domain-containing protein [Phytohabitans aurantiacus]|jgi:chitodextrinase|uniref:Hydrolase n=1 Tax=Phytohabitans aurantiacus TaxID=3016789 RepID=A0ABQ5R904_9ACTN|nr:cellulose binding domain-containing protein [Phytohabitans aurantiacus]GLI02863.1 hypothetical protein Pa4123_81410 [Phytohabitans aurantiacus]